MEISQLDIKKLAFHSRPIPIPVDYRPLYKIALITLILNFCCREEKSTLLKLHLFSWTLKSEENTQKLFDFINANFTSEFSVWGIEPALNRALQYAVADNICEVINGKYYKLTEKGAVFFQMIKKDKDLFVTEKAILQFIGKNKITDKRIGLMSKKWSKFYAENSSN
ncbi:MAG TPA: hypothetical protein VGO50_07300 [Pyrinomonadaceae bacterium]|jgi:hypothetical protein|nr:hypothetical protein [Pyrinomonadaceae bacterium]